MSVSRPLSPTDVLPPTSGAEDTTGPESGSRPTQSPHDPMIGRTLAGRYQIAGRVGAGSMGTVYRARHLPMARDVALKILHPDRALDVESKARFFREARATSALFSPNTVTVYDFGEGDTGELYLAMELLEGESLGARLRRIGRLPWREAIVVAIAALHSLNEAHAKGIIHRDLKPDNLLFARANDGSGREIVKLLDFGIAKILHDEELRLSPLETAAGTVFGTPRYMSPEQAQGKTLDPRSDLYSLGVILFHMVTGEAPFTDADAILVMAHHIKTIPARPAELEPSVPQALEAIILGALAKETDARPPSAQSMADALETVLLAATPEGSLRSRSSLQASLRTATLACLVTLASASAIFLIARAIIPTVPLAPLARTVAQTTAVLAEAPLAPPISEHENRVVPMVLDEPLGSTGESTPSVAAPAVRAPSSSQTVPPTATTAIPPKSAARAPAAAVRSVEPESSEPAAKRPTYERFE